ncbi:PerC family transcriptional regulator [Serratia marcescens]|nr:PerC family transcriptional regulator [Serratia marcescens]MBH3063786.1 PerC family transcriptional regulator [Serratia marcescens]
MEQQRENGIAQGRLASQIREAQRLEDAGYWRRAARQWLAAYDTCRDPDQREWLCRRRDACARRLREHALDYSSPALRGW